ncbi:D-glycero-beta-D-manno-heptose 1-phosphate adenylyltransferase [Candidatus Woesearchaeota archaeon]|nr:D-glycero-beta-D-manno-heptose 1-phosphate adenylyltransferase [Candidatus Woesearchaeota archaeon]
MGSIVTFEDLERIVPELRRQDKKIVTTNGAFDLLHVGHVRALQATKNLGDVLIVGVNSDSSVKKYKSDKRPVVGEHERAELVASLGCVDYVTIFSEPDPRAFLTVVRPDIHAKSGDYTAEKMIETPVVREYGGEVRIIPFQPGFSTTALIERIKVIYGSDT